MSAKIKITVDNNELKRGLQDAENQASKSFQNINNNAKKTGEGFKSLFKNLTWVLDPVNLVLKAVSTIKNMITGIFDSAHDAMMKADDVAKNARSLNMTTHGYQAINYAAQKAGTNIEKVNSIILNLQSSLSKAANGNMNLAKSFDKVGLSIARMSELSTEGQLLELLNMFKQYKDDLPSMINVATSLGFEKEQIRTINLMAKGDFARDVFAAKGRGAVISEEEIKQAEAYKSLLIEANSASVQLGKLAKDVLESREALKKFTKELGSGKNKNKGEINSPNQKEWMSADDIINKIVETVDKFSSVEDFVKYAGSNLGISSNEARYIYEEVKRHYAEQEKDNEKKNIWAKSLGAQAIDGTTSMLPTEIDKDKRKEFFLGDKTIIKNSSKFTGGKFRLNPEAEFGGEKIEDRYLDWPTRAYILLTTLKNGTNNWQTGSFSSDMQMIEKMLTVPESDKRYKKFQEYLSLIKEESINYRQKQSDYSEAINEENLTKAKLENAKRNSPNREQYINYSIGEVMRNKGYGVNGLYDAEDDIAKRGDLLIFGGESRLYSHLKDGSIERADKIGKLKAGDKEALKDIENRLDENNKKIIDIRKANKGQDTDLSKKLLEDNEILQEMYDYITAKKNIIAQLDIDEKRQLSDLKANVEKQKDIQKKLVENVKANVGSRYYDFDIKNGTKTLKNGYTSEDEQFIKDHMSDVAVTNNEVIGLYRDLEDSDLYKNADANAKLFLDKLFPAYLVEANMKNNGKMTAYAFNQKDFLDFQTNAVLERNKKMAELGFSYVQDRRSDPQWKNLPSNLQFAFSGDVEEELSIIDVMPEDQAKQLIRNVLDRNDEVYNLLEKARLFVESGLLQRTNQNMMRQDQTLDDAMSKRKTEQQRAKMNEYEKALGFAKDNVEQTKNRGVFSIVNAGNDLVSRGGFSSAASIITNSPKAFQQAVLDYQKIMKEYLVNMKSNVSTITDAYRE